MTNNACTMMIERSVFSVILFEFIIFHFDEGGVRGVTNGLFAKQLFHKGAVQPWKNASASKGCALKMS